MTTRSVTVYVFLISRPCDKGHAWPTVYTDRVLAQKAFGRVSEIRAVQLREILHPS